MNYKNRFNEYLRVVFSFLWSCVWQTSWQMLLTRPAALEDTAPAAVSKSDGRSLLNPRLFVSHLN